MIDITDRLREHPVAFIQCDCLRCEAADEIERLRTLVEPPQKMTWEDYANIYSTRS